MCPQMKMMIFARFVETGGSFCAVIIARELSTKVNMLRIAISSLVLLCM